jgi:hypothetical protein
MAKRKISQPFKSRVIKPTERSVSLNFQAKALLQQMYEIDKHTKAGHPEHRREHY